MDLNTTEKHLQEEDPLSLEIVRHIKTIEVEHSIETIVYFKFPLYREDSEVIFSPLVVLSPNSGLFIIGTSNLGERTKKLDLERVDSELDQIFNIIFSRLVKVKGLRKSKAILNFNMTPLIYAPNALETESPDLESEVITNTTDLSDLVINGNPLKEEQINLIRSVLEGSKGLFSVKHRDTEGFSEESKVKKLAQIETGIGLFDKDQKYGYMSVLSGPQRIRGLAGCGKTVVLAMKAALTHLQDPTAKICFTFHTKSLYQHVKRIVTRFYRQYDDKDPNWENFTILHAWGGKTYPGVYYNACQAHGHRAMPFGAAQGRSPSDPFGFACKDLLENQTISELYDYVFVDEAQDFNEHFLKLCLMLAKKQRLVWGADELQNIFQTKTVSLDQIKGVEGSKNYRSVTLEEDVVLHRCYRTPREILVVAHAMGFGLYGKIVQMLENRQHWVDLGYKVVNAE